jgi:hypothetical protein
MNWHEQSHNQQNLELWAEKRAGYLSFRLAQHRYWTEPTELRPSNSWIFLEIAQIIAQVHRASADGGPQFTAGSKSRPLRGRLQRCGLHTGYSHLSHRQQGRLLQVVQPAATVDGENGRAAGDLLEHLLTEGAEPRVVFGAPDRGRGEVDLQSFQRFGLQGPSDERLMIMSGRNG